MKSFPVSMHHTKARVVQTRRNKGSEEVVGSEGGVGSSTDLLTSGELELRTSERLDNVLLVLITTAH